VAHLLILVILPSLSHFFTTPEETNNSEQVVVNISTCGGLTDLWLNGCVIGALLQVVAHESSPCLPVADTHNEPCSKSPLRICLPILKSA
jgi:hypothetical protein